MAKMISIGSVIEELPNGTEGECRVIGISNINGTINQTIMEIDASDYDIEKNGYKAVFSFYAKYSDDASEVKPKLVVNVCSDLDTYYDDTTFSYPDELINVEVEKDWTRFVIATENAIGNTIKMAVNSMETTSKLYLCMGQLESGETESDWTEPLTDISESVSKSNASIRAIEERTQTMTRDQFGSLIIWSGEKGTSDYSEMKLSSGAITFSTGDSDFSQFSSKYVQFGDFQIREVADYSGYKGICFSWAGEEE